MSTLQALTFLGGLVCLIAIMLTLAVNTKRERLLGILGWIAWASSFVCLGSALIRWYLAHN